MSIVWNRCRKVSENGWFDLEKNIAFSLDQNWTNSPSRDSFFVSSKEDFLSNNRWDLDYVLRYYGEFLGSDVISNQEIVYKNLPELEKFKGSKVLIVGAGPSAIQSDWDPKDYDFIFSCNHFYLNEKLRNIDVAFAVFTTETDFSEDNKDFHNYMQNNSTIICFEDRLDPKGREPFKPIKELYPERVTYAHTRYRAKIGAIPRVICMAALFGCNEIHLVGADGMAKNQRLGDTNGHAFQEGKVLQGTADYDLYRRHYVALWDYLLSDIGKNVKFQNLGEGHPSNMTTDISIQNFPLENKMKNSFEDGWLHPGDERFYCGGKKTVEIYNTSYNLRKEQYKVILNDEHTDKIEDMKTNGFTKWEQVLDHDLLDAIKDKVDFCIKNNTHLKSIDEHYATLADPFLISDEVQQLAFSDHLINFATNYFGCMPVIGTFNLRRSFLNDLEPKTTQMFHRDKNSVKFFKFFIYLNDVDTIDDGPLTIVKDSWNKMPHFHNNIHRWSEKQIKNLYGEDSLIYLAAKKGDLLTGFTTSFHRGTKPVSKERTMLTLNFGVHPELQGAELPNRNQLFKIKRKQYEDLPENKKPVADFLVKEDIQ